MDWSPVYFSSVMGQSRETQVKTSASMIYIFQLLQSWAEDWYLLKTADIFQFCLHLLRNELLDKN